MTKKITNYAFKSAMLLLLTLALGLKNETDDDDSPIVFDMDLERLSTVLRLDFSGSNKNMKRAPSTARTIQVKKQIDFPRILAPGQRIAIFLDKLVDDDDYFKSDCVVEFRFKSLKKKDGRKHPEKRERGKGEGDDKVVGNQIAILLNNKPLLRASPFADVGKVRALMPRSFFEKHGNILQIRENGGATLLVESLLINTGDIQLATLSIPRDALALNSAITDFANLGDVYQKKLLTMIPFLVAKGLQVADAPDVLGIYELLRRNVGFTNALTGKPRKSLTAFKAIAPLFDGQPFRIESNLLPLSAEDHLTGVAWAAIVNNSHMTTALVVSKHADGGEVELTFPVEQIDGGKVTSTRVTLFSGIIPNDAPAEFAPGVERTFVKSTLEPIENGMVKYRFKLSQCSLIEFKFGKRRDEDVQKISLAPLKIKRTVFKRLRCSKKQTRPPSSSLIYPLRPPGIWAKSNGFGVELEIAQATRSLIAGVRNVVPWDSQSVFARFKFPKGGKGVPNPGTATVFLRRSPTIFDSFEFWVRPSDVKGLKTIGLTIYLVSKNDKKTGIVKCGLRPNVWQRVSVPRGSGDHQWQRLIVAPDPTSGDFKRSNKITYEFNGFNALINAAPGFHRRVSFKKDGRGRLKSMTIIILDSPGKIVGCAYPFKKPIAILDFESSSPRGSVDIEPKVSFIRHAQVLNFRLQIPRKRYFVMTESLSKILTDKEKKLLKTKEVYATTLTVRLSKTERDNSKSKPPRPSN